MKRMLQHVYVTFYGVQVWYKRFLEETELCVYILCIAGKKKLHIYHTLFPGNIPISFDEMI